MQETEDKPAAELTEIDARAEVDAIDRLVTEAKEMIERLGERRRSIIHVAEQSARLAAAILHNDYCTDGHDRSGTCTWETESKGFNRWSGKAHMLWLWKAKRKIKESGLSDGDYTDKLRSITSEGAKKLALEELEPDNKETW